jgi:hypothetical protein
MAASWSRTSFGICPQDCVLPGSKSGSLGSRKASGFRPENEQIDCAMSSAIGVVFPVLAKLPVDSPANAAVAFAPVKTAAQSMAATNDFYS